MDKIVIHKGEKYLVCVEWEGCHYAANVVLTSPNIPKSSGFKKIPHEAIGDIEKMKSFIVNIIQNIGNHELSVLDKWDGVLDGEEGNSEVTSSEMVEMTQKEQEEVCYKLWDELPIEYRDISEYSDFAVGFMTCAKYFKSNGQLMLKKK